MRNPLHLSPPLHRTIVLAGLAGALAEVVWVALFCGVTAQGGFVVLRQIAASFTPQIVDSAWAPAIGLAEHFALGILVAYGFALVLWRPFAKCRGAAATLAVALLALAAIWTMNFFVLLPVVNAQFVHLLPYAVTFLSKLLFGLAMAATLSTYAAQPLIAPKHRHARGLRAAGV